MLTDRDRVRQARDVFEDEDAMAGGLVALAFFVCVIALITLGFL